jgi:hypothetical protein
MADEANIDHGHDTARVNLEAQIVAWFPENARAQAIADLQFLLELEYLRGQRDELLDQIEKRKTKQIKDLR